jgi:CO/xanthine dehydrogenase Mo-binding subunit/aerobic-type carbon monoxide dehydrogenase small subunit (CoxS/CutS family)
MKRERIAFELNGAPLTVETDPAQSLLDLLRDELDLTGTKKGCDYEGQCGACTVLVDGRAVRACLTPIGKLARKQIVTIEGIGTPGQLHPLQQAFINQGAVQCGYCTPGMIMAAKALLDRNPNPARADVLRALQGNLCRCTGYVKIVEAVISPAAGLNQNGSTPPVDIPQAIGGSLHRQNGVGKVTGTTHYAGDIKMPGMLHAKVLRSPYAHAKITRIETEPARNVPGVRGVFTGADVPGVKCFADIMDAGEALAAQKLSNRAREPILAEDRVRMIGEPIAIVVAGDEKSAQAGVEAIRVTYELLESIFDPQTALLESTAALHPGGNVYETDRIVKGNARVALETAEVYVEAGYSMPSQDHVTLEPESIVAYIDPVGRVVVMGPTQQPHVRKEQIAAMLDIAPGRVQVIAAEMGGSFGGRHYFWPVVATALPAFLLQQPVKLIYTRREVFEATFKQHPFQLEYQVGARPDGKLLGLRVRALGNAIGPYHWPAIEYDTRIAHTNWANAGPFRGYGLQQGVFALECCLDELAVRLAIDPLELRLLNAVDQQSGTTLGQSFDEPFEFQSVLTAIRPEWAAMRRATKTLHAQTSGNKRFGAGLAAAWYRFSKAGATQVSAQAGLDPDGRITLYYTAVKSGQGLDTVMSQLAAHELGVPRAAIALVNGDTAATVSSQVYGGCRSTYWIGGAIQQAARTLKHAILSTVAELLDITPEKLRLAGHEVYVTDARPQSIPLRQVAAEWQRTGQPLKYTGSFSLNGRLLQDGPSHALGHYVAGVALAQVRVNVKSGKVKVLRVVVAQDVGRAINPVDLQGQIEGAVVMELGATLMEEYIPGQTLNLKHYRIPRIRDVPEIKVLLIERPGKHGPLGAKGAGEAVMGHVRAAIANAVYDATGVRIHRLPATPARVLEALAIQAEQLLTWLTTSNI